MCKSILTIDDSVMHHKLIQTILEPDGLSMQSAFDGESGLAAARCNPPDLILLDIDMPGMDGFDVCRHLKSTPETAEIPVIFLTANALTTEKSKGLSIGALDYIAKPIKPDDLRMRVRGALRSPRHLDAVSLVDVTTGLWNRTYLEMQVHSMASLATRCGTSLACIVIEVEQPQRLMESFGDVFVADLLRGMGRILTGGFRTEDVVSRYDDWKFAIVATNANRAAAALIADRLVKQVERQLEFRRGREVRITCRAGVADTLGTDTSMLIASANAAIGGAQSPGQTAHELSAA